MAQIKSGELAALLQKVVEFGREHVSSCWLCSQKGFVCEVCNKPKPLFPFDVEHIYRVSVFLGNSVNVFIFYFVYSVRLVMLCITKVALIRRNHVENVRE